MPGYKIRKLEPANPSNPRGQRTWHWGLADDRQTAVMRRLENEAFGNHFHKGDDPSKNPEFILFLEGAVRVELLDKDGKYSSVRIDTKDGPVELVIEPWVLHRLVAETDALYIESRLSRFDPSAPDTYPAEEFPHQFPEK